LFIAYLDKLRTFKLVRARRAASSTLVSQLKKPADLLPHIVSRERTLLHAKKGPNSCVNWSRQSLLSAPPEYLSGRSFLNLTKIDTMNI